MPRLSWHQCQRNHGCHKTELYSPGFASSCFAQSAARKLIPQRLQIIIVQSHQPHPRINLQSVLQSRLCNLQLAHDRIAAGQVVVHQSVLRMLLDGFKKYPLRSFK